jgi:hypothetical protein
LSGRPIVNGHLNLHVFRQATGLLLWGRHPLWRNRNDDLGLR